uniref:Uncharacterized protein n=1 Tax=Arundo donax TaxID=35708 RepID=A0A0A8XU01_ARUDO
MLQYMVLKTNWFIYPNHTGFFGYSGYRPVLIGFKYRGCYSCFLLSVSCYLYEIFVPSSGACSLKGNPLGP